MDSTRYLEYCNKDKRILGFFTSSAAASGNTYKVDVEFIRNVNSNKHTHVTIDPEGNIISYKKEVSKDLEEVIKCRSFQYKEESDSLFMEWQFAVATGSADADIIKKQWISAVKQIKNNNPKAY